MLWAMFRLWRIHNSLDAWSGWQIFFWLHFNLSFRKHSWPAYQDALGIFYKEKISLNPFLVFSLCSGWTNSLLSNKFYRLDTRACSGEQAGIGTSSTKKGRSTWISCYLQACALMFLLPCVVVVQYFYSICYVLLFYHLEFGRVWTIKSEFMDTGDCSPTLFYKSLDSLSVPFSLYLHFSPLGLLLCSLEVMPECCVVFSFVVTQASRNRMEMISSILFCMFGNAFLSFVLN